jgi:hypothetical protein
MENIPEKEFQDIFGSAMTNAVPGTLVKDISRSHGYMMLGGRPEYPTMEQVKTTFQVKTTSDLHGALGYDFPLAWMQVKNCAHGSLDTTQGTTTNLHYNKIMLL